MFEIASMNRQMTKPFYLRNFTLKGISQYNVKPLWIPRQTSLSNLFLHRHCQFSLWERISPLHKRFYLMFSTNDEDIGAVPSWLQDWELTLGLHATWPPALLQEYLKGVAKVCASFGKGKRGRLNTRAVAMSSLALSSVSSPCRLAYGFSITPVWLPGIRKKSMRANAPF